MKIDFMDRDDQEMVNWYEKITAAAAEHKLMVNFHGAFKTSGFDRTYPNQVTREGILGNEYNKWSDRVTPEHKLTLPFTRYLEGPGRLHAGRLPQSAAEPVQDRTSSRRRCRAPAPPSSRCSSATTARSAASANIPTTSATSRGPTS